MFSNACPGESYHISLLDAIIIPPHHACQESSYIQFTGTTAAIYRAYKKIDKSEIALYFVKRFNVRAFLLK